MLFFYFEDIKWLYFERFFHRECLAFVVLFFFPPNRRLIFFLSILNVFALVPGMASESFGEHVITTVIIIFDDLLHGEESADSSG